MRILVTYGSKRGGTAGLAEMVTEALRDLGHEPEIRPAGALPDPRPFDVVIVGGAVYSGRWHSEARRYVKHYTPVLATKDVWLFSSGPLDRSAEVEMPGPTPGVRRLLRRIAARGHATFGGRLEPETGGLIAARMASRQAGDFRNPAMVEQWVGEIDGALSVHPEYI